MSNSLLNPRVDPSQWEPKLPFDLVVAYEDAATRNRALHLYDHLAEQLLDDYDFQCSWWKFDHLTNAVLREQAAEAAAEAHMIIVSLRWRKELPSTHRLWMESWIPRRDNRKAALVALIAGAGGNESGTSPLLGYLQKAARLARMDFFTHTFDLPKPQMEFSARQIAERARTVTPVLENILHQKMPIPRWGINE